MYKAKKTIPLITIYLILLLSVFLGACAKSPSSDGKMNESPDQVASLYPLTITDFLGREVTIPQMPERIVSLAPSTTEILFELGLGDRIVGVTDYDNYPEEARRKPRVGGFKGPNLEAIVAQQPDLIFASSLSGKEQMEVLEKLGIPVVMLEAGEISRINKTIELLGAITNSKEKAARLIAAFNGKLEELAARLQDIRQISVYYIVDLQNNWTAGRGTFIHELINLAGGRNVAEDVEGWANYSLEKIVEKNPQVIITSTHTGKPEDLQKKAGFQDLDAVKNNRVYIFEDSNIISRPSHRIADGLEQLIRFLHPEVLE